MKTAKRAVLLVLCAMLLVIASVLGTMAYLTDTKTVTNTFTVGDVKITLDEAKVDVYGNPLDADGVKVDKVEDAVRLADGNTYKLIPNHSYTKDPTIHVDADSEEAYLFVTITDEIAAIQDTKTIAEQLAANGWVIVTGQSNVYYNTRKYVPGEATDYKVFESFKIKNNVSNETLATYKDEQIVVVASAIQADGFDTAEAAWAAAGASITENPNA